MPLYCVSETGTAEMACKGLSETSLLHFISKGIVLPFSLPVLISSLSLPLTHVDAHVSPAI